MVSNILKLLVEDGKPVAKGYPIYKRGGEAVMAEDNGRLYHLPSDSGEE